LNHYVQAENVDTIDCIKQLYHDIAVGLHEAASKTVLITRSRPGSEKFWWNTDLKDVKTATMSSHATWVAAGRPRSGDIYIQRNIDRLKYRKLIYQLKTKNKACLSK